ncbi:hypothetical protein MVEG_11421 [Podila verticillata NRRL 6337]|uniref:C2H2-type domain-containing protein n=1 Tax=Podila verticillata NRRL 6337 TaxID=1069443 RepID=A0A086TLS0_9FUNG|nr:hypothetical protein MVEG_11421 [Podila verticillata NRRL 6337]
MAVLLPSISEQHPKSSPDQKHLQEATPRSPPLPTIQPRPSRSTSSVVLIYPKASNVSAPSILQHHSFLMIKQKQQMSQGPQGQSQQGQGHHEHTTHASPRPSDRPTHALPHPDHHIMNGPPKGPYRDPTFAIAKHAHSRSQSQSLDQHGNYPGAQPEVFDYHHHHGHNHHNHLPTHPAHPHPAHPHAHHHPHPHPHPMPHPGPGHSRSHSQSQPPGPRTHHPSYIAPGPHQHQQHHPSTGPIRSSHAQPRHSHPQHPYQQHPHPESRTHSRTPQPSHPQQQHPQHQQQQPQQPQQPQQSQQQQQQQPHYDQGFNGPPRTSQGPERYPMPPSSRRHSNSRHGSSMVDDDEDEDDGEIKQESNRAHPSDGAAKNDNSEHEVHKCMDCGKVYKHPNCLWKHRWEHSTYWKSATKFLLSKHQQVRMMEAAAILLGIDEARAADKDMIVSTVIKQRGMGSSSSSSSPPTSTKSLSRSPPPSSEATRRRAASAKPTEQPKEESLPSSLATTPRPRPSVSETQNDIMMLTALRKASSAPSKISGDQPQAVPSISPKNPSSSSSTPPTLADDESVPELDEMVVSPPQPSGPNPTDKGMGLGMGMSVGMSMAMDVDPKHYSRDPHQPFHAQQPSQQAYRFPSSYQHPPHPSYPTQQ